jgi:hypothetical protein
MPALIGGFGKTGSHHIKIKTNVLNLRTLDIIILGIIHFKVLFSFLECFLFLH